MLFCALGAASNTHGRNCASNYTGSLSVGLRCGRNIPSRLRVRGTRVLLSARARILRSGLASARARHQTSRMRALVAILVSCALFFGVYHYYFKKMPVTDQGTAPTQAISLTGVRGDLLQIAQAERGYIAQNGHCTPLGELISSNSLAMSRLERDGYTYSVECSGGDFSVTARHAPAAAGSPIRYPTLAIDQNMSVREVN